MMSDSSSNQTGESSYERVRVTVVHSTTLERERSTESPSGSGQCGKPENKSLSNTGFAQQAEGKSAGIVREFVDFLRFNKKWWLIPLVVVLMLVGIALFAGGGAAAPFIYTLF